VTASWIVDAIPERLARDARGVAAQRLIHESIRPESTREQSDEAALRFVGDALELALIESLESTVAEADRLEADLKRVRIAADAFHVLRTTQPAGGAFDIARFFLRVGTIGVLADRGTDVSRFLKDNNWPELPLSSPSWGDRTLATVLDVWLRTLRKDGWNDLLEVQNSIVRLRSNQAEFERQFLDGLGETDRGRQRQNAWQLIVYYHLAKAAEVLASYTSIGRVGDGFDVREQLQAQFDLALVACSRAAIVEWDILTRLLAHAASQLVENSVWTATRAVNSRVSEFVQNLVSPDNPRPLFDLLPPQRRALREAGLRGGGDRAIVVNLPTSSGKTFLAEFRILQAINQFERERGWVAYVAPTRALVNQVCARLRRDFAPMGIVVERVSPALEMDTLESGLLTDTSIETQFRILVTTPEKLDLMIRGGCEGKIGRPLTLVVVDEAHNIAEGERGLKLELLLATINRECQNAQFLLLTPFIKNAKEVARWLSPESNSTVELSVNWAPNDRIIALSRAEQTEDKTFRVFLETIHTSKETLATEGTVALGDGRPLRLTWNKVKNSGADLAAATTQYLKARGPTIVLCSRPDWAWGQAIRFKQPENRRDPSENIALVQRYLSFEFGDGFELVDLLNYRVGVHHAGLSDEAKAMMEWLFEEEELEILVATTTIAQGVNFPVAGVVLAQHTFFDGAQSVPMSAADFWNIAGRAGRADHSAAGVIALAAVSDGKAADLRQFVGAQVETLSSTLVQMVSDVLESEGALQLHTLFYRPEWSAFLQYLAHTYRQIGDQRRFAQQIDRILRGTLGYQRLRESNRDVAQALVDSAQVYATRIADKPLGLVDSTGFSWEAISITLGNLSRDRITESVWTPSLFDSNDRTLPKLMGILLEVPELRENLEAATGGRGRDGALLAKIVSDWVRGTPVSELASKYFSTKSNGQALSKTESLTECCRNLYGRLAHSASWGLSALQAMTLGDRFDSMTEREQQSIRNLPSRVFYGVSSDDAISLRLLGIPRGAAEPLAVALRGVLDSPLTGQPLPNVRRALTSASTDVWRTALGDRGSDVQRVWKIMEAVL
jgi:superfamily II DNA/RNA helicase